MLQGSLTTKDHLMDGFTAAELVDGLKKLASNKHNSNNIMKKNIMTPLVKLLRIGMLFCCKESIVICQVYILLYKN